MSEVKEYCTTQEKEKEEDTAVLSDGNQEYLKSVQSVMGMKQRQFNKLALSPEVKHESKIPRESTRKAKSVQKKKSIIPTSLLFSVENSCLEPVEKPSDYLTEQVKP